MAISALSGAPIIRKNRKRVLVDLEVIKNRNISVPEQGHIYPQAWSGLARPIRDIMTNANSTICICDGLNR